MSENFTWGTVTAVGPLRVMLDGDTAALPLTPDSLIDPRSLSVNDRVRCERAGRRIIVHGSPSVGGVPVGNVEFTARSTAPTGWLLCDGTAVSRTTFAALFAAIGTTYGAGNGTTTFNVPNLRGRAPVGRDAGQIEFDTLGETGGAKTHTLTTAEMPSHTHVQNGHSHTLPGLTRTSGAGSNQSGTGVPPHNGAPSADQGIQSAATSSVTPTNQNTGGGGAHNNLQPYLVLNPIIKT